MCKRQHSIQQAVSSCVNSARQHFSEAAAATAGDAHFLHHLEAKPTGCSQLDASVQLAGLLMPAHQLPANTLFPRLLASSAAG